VGVVELFVLAQGVQQVSLVPFERLCFGDLAKAAMIVPLRELIGEDRELEALFGEPAGAAFERAEDGFVRVAR
jgi:hypothetical protein